MGRRPSGTPAEGRDRPERSEPRFRGGTLSDARSDEHHIRVARTARFHTLGDPAGPIREVWFVCHGYGQLAGRFIRRFAPIASDARLIVAPEALNRYYIEEKPGPHGPDSRVGATWMTREDRLAEIDDYVAYLDALYAHLFETFDRGAVQVYALGFSQGAATACRWVTLGTSRVDRLILWSSFLPVDLDLVATAERLRAVRPILVAGTQDSFASPEMAEHDAERLRELGVDVRVVTFEGGHSIDPAVLGQVAMEQV